MLLAVLATPRTVKEMAEAFDLTPATIGATANHLEQAGILQIVCARRSITVSLDPGYPAHPELVALLCAAAMRDAKVVPIPVKRTCA